VNDPIAIIGGGSIGLLLCAHFARAGLPVTLLCRTPEQAAAIRAAGITVDPGNGRDPWTVRPEVDVMGAVSSLFPWVVLAVKTPAVAGVLSTWPAGLGSAAVVAVENGLAAARQVFSAFGPDRAMVAITRLGATRLDPAQVRQAGQGDTLIGALDPQAQAHLGTVAGWFRAAALPVHVTADGLQALWWKTILNAAINPLASVLGVTNGQLLERAEWYWLLRAVVEEAVAAAGGEGIVLEAERVFQDVLDTLRETAANRCSMLVDVESRRPTELDAITGAVLAAADRAHLTADANRALYHLVRARVAAPGP
jgi:2-dehydropantoate 2-reductase